MNITSVLSAGYLQPISVPRTDASQSEALNKIFEEARIREQTGVRGQRAEEADLARKEQDILSQERALKAKAGQAEVQTIYQYSIGVDGRRYITGASVTVTGDPDDVSRVGGGVTSREVRIEANETAGSEKQAAIATGDAAANGASSNEGAQSGNTGSEAGTDSAASSVGLGKKLSASEQATVNQLKQAEAEVRAHEAAHKAAAGEFGGSISYTYTKGPDGKNYITGGEVPIQMREGSTPEETVRNMQQVQRAAQAPASPSGQDLKVAAQAAAKAAAAQAQASAERAQKLSGSNKSNSSDSPDKTPEPAASSVKPNSSVASDNAVAKSIKPVKSAIDADGNIRYMSSAESDGIDDANKTAAVKKSDNHIDTDTHEEPATATVAKGTPVIDPRDDPEDTDPTMAGVSPLLASLKQSVLTQPLAA